MPQFDGRIGFVKKVVRQAAESEFALFLLLPLVRQSSLEAAQFPQAHIWRSAPIIRLILDYVSRLAFPLEASRRNSPQTRHAYSLRPDCRCLT